MEEVKFHLVLAAGTKNGVLSGFMSIAKSILRRDQLHLLGIHTKEQLEITARVHRDIFEALKLRNRGLASAAMQRHNDLLRFYLLKTSVNPPAEAGALD